MCYTVEAKAYTGPLGHCTERFYSRKFFDIYTVYLGTIVGHFSSGLGAIVREILG
jgi:hypothetical protein